MSLKELQENRAAVRFKHFRHGHAPSLAKDTVKTAQGIFQPMRLVIGCYRAHQHSK
jgi:hypothetical protein